MAASQDSAFVESEEPTLEPFLRQNPDSLLPPPPYKSRARWYMLLTFSLFAYNQGLFWLTYSSMKLSDLHKTYSPATYNPRTVALLLNWGPIFGIFCAPFQTWLASRPKGLHKACTLGILLCFVSALLRFIPDQLGWQDQTTGLIMVHAAQILNAIAGPLCAGMVSRLACVWFPAKERKIATAIGIASNTIGTSTGFILGPRLGLQRLLELQLLLSVVSVTMYACGWKVFAVEETALERSDLMEGMKLACRDVDFAKVIVAVGLINGVSNAWQGVLQNVLSDRYSSKVGGVIAAFNGFAANVGTISVGVISRSENAQRDLTIGASLLLCCVLAFIATVEEETRSQLSLDIVFASTTLAGFFAGLVQPLFYGLAARLIYPVNEGTSIGLIVLMINVASLSIVFLSAELQPAWINYSYAGSVLVAVGFISCIRSN